MLRGDALCVVVEVLGKIHNIIQRLSCGRRISLTQGVEVELMKVVEEVKGLRSFVLNGYVWKFCDMY